MKMKTGLIAVALMLGAGYAQAAVVSGGYIQDAGYAAMMEKSGLLHVMVRNAVKTYALDKIYTNDKAGTLLQSEINLRTALQNTVDISMASTYSPSDVAIDHILLMIKSDTKWVTRGEYCPYGDLQSMIDTNWAKILVRYQQ